LMFWGLLAALLVDWAIFNGVSR